MGQCPTCKLKVVFLIILVTAIPLDEVIIPWLSSKMYIKKNLVIYLKEISESEEKSILLGP